MPTDVSADWDTSESHPPTLRIPHYFPYQSPTVDAGAHALHGTAAPPHSPNNYVHGLPTGHATLNDTTDALALFPGPQPSHSLDVDIGAHGLHGTDAFELFPAPHPSHNFNVNGLRDTDASQLFPAPHPSDFFDIDAHAHGLHGTDAFVLSPGPHPPQNIDAHGLHGADAFELLPAPHPSHNFNVNGLRDTDASQLFPAPHPSDFFDVNAYAFGSFRTAQPNVTTFSDALPTSFPQTAHVTPNDTFHGTDALALFPGPQPSRSLDVDIDAHGLHGTDASQLFPAPHPSDFFDIDADAHGLHGTDAFVLSPGPHPPQNFNDHGPRDTNASRPHPSVTPNDTSHVDSSTPKDQFSRMDWCCPVRYITPIMQTPILFPVRDGRVYATFLRTEMPSVPIVSQPTQRQPYRRRTATGRGNSQGGYGLVYTRDMDTQLASYCPNWLQLVTAIADLAAARLPLRDLWQEPAELSIAVAQDIKVCVLMLKAEHGTRWTTEREVALNCAMHSLGEPEAPTPLVLGWISAHVVAKLAQQRISLLSTIHRHFLEKTQGDVYGVLSGLESQSRNGTLLDSASGRKWGSPLLAAILKLFLADTRWSISRELFSRHIPVPTLKLAVIFVYYLVHKALNKPISFLSADPGLQVIIGKVETYIRTYARSAEVENRLFNETRPF